MQPHWFILLQQLGLVLLTVAVIAGEYLVMRSALESFVLGVEPVLISVMAVGVLVGYAVIWHAVGDRLERAEEVRLSVDGPGRAGLLNPAFGVLGLLYAIGGVATGAAVAYLRADEMATRAAEDAARRARSDFPAVGADATSPETVWLHSYGGTLLAEMVMNAALMGLMALVAIALASPRHQLATVARLQRALRRSELLGTRAAAAEVDAVVAQRDVDRLVGEVEQQAAMDDIAGESLLPVVGRAKWGARSELAAALRHPDVLTRSWSAGRRSAATDDRLRDREGQL